MQRSRRVVYKGGRVSEDSEEPADAPGCPKSTDPVRSAT
jgi:hypothetical protein